MIKQILTLYRAAVRSEFSDPSRLLTPILFAGMLLLLFQIGFGDAFRGLGAIAEQNMLLTQVFLTLMFALEASFSRIFSSDREDRVFAQLQASPLSPYAWFLGRYFSVVTTGAIIVAPFILGLLLFGAKVWMENYLWLSVLITSVAGLASLGVLLSLITMTARGRELLFPLLYFPLAIPVVIASLLGSQAALVGDMELFLRWLGLLGSFDLIYITLGILLFAEIVDCS